MEQEGVSFDEAGRASPLQRLTAQELVVLAGLDDQEASQNPEPLADDDEGRAAQFWEQLRHHQSQASSDALEVVLDAWVHLGGTLQYGTSDETSCFLMARIRPASLWPLTIYPKTGKVEVVFQYLATRPPFDDIALRHAFRERLNLIEGVNIAEARIDLRPGFELVVLETPAARDLLIQQLAWFMAEGA